MLEVKLHCLPVVDQNTFNMKTSYFLHAKSSVFTRQNAHKFNRARLWMITVAMPVHKVNSHAWVIRSPTFQQHKILTLNFDKILK